MLPEAGFAAVNVSADVGAWALHESVTFKPTTVT
jgi:hypothetical protein